MPDSDASMTDLSQSMPALSQSMTGNGNKSYKESYCESKNKRERKKNPEPKTARALSSSTENEQDLGQIETAVQEMQQWMLDHDPPLKFMPASKDGQHEATREIVAKRLREGIPTQDIKAAVDRVPLDNDPNPSFTVRDNLDTAINQVLNSRKADAAQAKLLRKVEARERAKALAELAEVDRKRAEEESLVEDHLGL
jgi:hypothetical protein